MNAVNAKVIDTGLMAWNSTYGYQGDLMKDVAFLVIALVVPKIECSSTGQYNRTTILFRFEMVGSD